MIHADDPSARVVRVTSLPMSPGQCGICGKSDHPDGFVYFGMDFEFYGTLYFCRDCVGDFAKVFGFVDPVGLDQMQAKVAMQEQELVILREAVLDLESAVDKLSSARVTLSSLPGPRSDSALSAPSSDESAGDAMQDANSDGNEPVESVSEQGPDDVRSTNDSDLLGL